MSRLKIDCKRCGGKGEVENWETTPGGHRISVTDDCPACSRLRWVDCTEQPPDHEVPVLVWNGHDYGIDWIDNYRHDGPEWAGDSNDIPTHWMHLPTPPAPLEANMAPTEPKSAPEESKREK